MTYWLKTVTSPSEKLDEKSFLTTWQDKDITRLTNFFQERKTSDVFYTRMKEIEKNNPDKFSMQEAHLFISDNSDIIIKALKISKEYYSDITKNSFYSEIVLRISKVLATINPFELSFLLEYVNIDEHGLLFLFNKFIFKSLKAVLASQVIIALYKPETFKTFLKTAVSYTLSNSNLLLKSKILTAQHSKLITLAGVSSLTLGITLYSSVWTRKALPVLPTYTGITSPYVTLFQDLGSKIIYEIAKTISTLSNAAIAGFLDPKQEIFKKIIQN